MDKCCYTCDYWQYDKYLEEKYGMGCGICKLDNQVRFCDHHNCPFHSEGV